MFGDYEKAIAILKGLREKAEPYSDRAQVVTNCIDVLQKAWDEEEAQFAKDNLKESMNLPERLCGRCSTTLGPRTFFIELYKDQEVEVCQACYDQETRAHDHTSYMDGLREDQALNSGDKNG